MLELLREASREARQLGSAAIAGSPNTRADEIDPVAAGIERLLASPPSAPFTELPLPAALPERRSERASPSLPSGYRAVRSERSGARVVSIALPSALDPSGEIGNGSYWLLESLDGDTDGDGIPDGHDVAPQIPANGERGVPADLLDAFFGAGGPPISLVGDRRDFHGYTPPHPLIVLTSKEAAQLSERAGVFYPMSISFLVNRARDEAVIQVFETWRGGTYSAKKRDGKWRITMTSGWIT